MKEIKLGNVLGYEFQEDFLEFDLSEIQEVLSQLAETSAIDIAHAEMLQQKSLRGADIISEYLSKIVKTVSYLDTRISSLKNKAALEFKTTDGSKATIDLRKFAAECAPEVEELMLHLAKAKGSKVLLEKKYDILIKSHHHYKDIGSGMKKTIPSWE